VCIFFFIMRYLMGVSGCDSVLSANKPIFMWENFCIGSCMYFIGATVSHDVKNHWPDHNRKSNPKSNTSIELKSFKIREYNELK
jgi:hypothetical protein